MQITLAQNEIEKAIQEFLAQRITIAEGTHMSIEMRATRGAEGFSAVIDLDDPKDVAVPTAPSVVERPVAKAQERVQPQVKAEVPEPKEEEVEVVAEKPATAKIFQKKKDTKEEVDTKADSVDETTEEAKPKTKSLFSGLKN